MIASKGERHKKQNEIMKVIVGGIDGKKVLQKFEVILRYIDCVFNKSKIFEILTDY